MNVGYILNLSANFNANNFLYYFLPGISSGKILLFEQLTANPLTIQANKQQEDIQEKIRIVKEDWDFRRLNPLDQTHKINIHIVLDQSDWKFTNFGIYSTLIFVKLQILKGIIDKYFTVNDLKNIRFRYFILSDDADEKEKLGSFLDAKCGWKGDVRMDSFDYECFNSFPWPDADIITQKINRLKIPTDHLPVVSNITDAQQQELNKFLQEISTEIQTGFSQQNNSLFNSYLEESLNQLKADFQEKIRKVGDLNNPAIILDIFKNFFKRFSSQYYLRNRSDLLFYMDVHTLNNQRKIQSYDKFSAFLTESINFFAQNEPVDFVNNQSDSRKNQILLEDIIIDDEARRKLLEQYFTSRETCRDHLKGSGAGEITVELFDLNTVRFSGDELKWNDDQVEFFQKINGLKSRIPFFFTREKADELRQILNQNSIQTLENALRERREQSNLHQTERAFSDKQTQKLNSSEARIELERLKKEEAAQKLSSNVDLDKYEKAKSEHSIVTAPLHQKFLESLYLLPKMSDTKYFYILAFVLLFLLVSPFYTFTFWQFAFVFSFIFSVLIALLGLVICGSISSKISKYYEAIFLENVKLFKSLDEYRKSLQKLSDDIRKNTLRRKNIQALETALSSMEEQKKKLSIHEDYYDKIIKQIESNGFTVQHSRERTEIIFQISPDQNFRKSVNQDKKLKIRNGNSESEYSNVISQLGIITQINFKTQP